MQYVIVSKFDPDLTKKLSDQVPAAVFELIHESAKTNFVPDMSTFIDLGMRSDAAELLLQHVSHITDLRKRGLVSRGGPTTDLKFAINLFNANSEEEARAYHDADVWVRDGILTVHEVFEWRQAF